LAEKLKEFEFTRMGRGKPGYWEKFLDGDIWQLGIEDAPNGSAKDVESIRGSISGYVRRQQEANNPKFVDMALRTQIVREYDEDGEPSEDPADSLLVVQLVEAQDEE
jgi:hypothetical protein